LQNLSNYPVSTAGLVMAPRGVGTMAAMMIAGRLSARVDPRKLMGVGIALLLWSLWVMMRWTPDVSERSFVAVVFIQGAGLGFVFIPLQVIGFATLEPRLRTDGTALFALFRNVGAAIGISVTSAMLAHNIQVVHSDLGAFVTPFTRALQGNDAVSHALNPAT